MKPRESRMNVVKKLRPQVFGIPESAREGMFCAQVTRQFESV